MFRYGVLLLTSLKSDDNSQCTNARVPFPVIHVRTVQLVTANGVRRKAS